VYVRPASIFFVKRERLIGCLDTRLESKYHVPRLSYREFNEATNCRFELNMCWVCFHRKNKHTLRLL